MVYKIINHFSFRVEIGTTLDLKYSKKLPFPVAVLTYPLTRTNDDQYAVTQRFKRFTKGKPLAHSVASNINPIS